MRESSVMDYTAIVNESSSLPVEHSSSRNNYIITFWHRLALTLILALSAFLNLFQLDQNGYGNTYYAAAVKSMLMNWHNLFFLSFYPGCFVSIVKPSLGFWL